MPSPKASPTLRFQNREIYCSKGITVRAMRQSFRVELSSNDALRQELERAAGGDLFALVKQVSMTGHGADLRVMGRAMGGKSAALMVNVLIGAILQEGEFRAGRTLPVKVDHAGLTRRVTVAPARWFCHTGNAAAAVNAVKFEDFIGLAGGDFRVLLRDGIDRCEAAFEDLCRPRSELPIWVRKQLSR